MRRRSAGPAILLAAWLLPLAAQVGTLVHLLQAGRHEHPPAMVELLVHGHPHGGRVPAHDHSVREGPPAGRAVSLPADLPVVAGPGSSAARLVHPGPGRSDGAARARAAAPLRHLLLVVLLR